jgi:hypothetical protein
MTAMGFQAFISCTPQLLSERIHAYKKQAKRKKRKRGKPFISYSSYKP